MNSQDVVKVQQFLAGSRDLHVREIVSGTNLSVDVVEMILDAAVGAGEVTKTGEANVAIYNLAGIPVPAVETPTTPWKSTEQIWADSERARVLAEEKAKAPKPSPRLVITEAEVEAALPAPPVPLSKEEREFLEVSTKNRRGANPQAFIVK